MFPNALSRYNMPPTMHDEKMYNRWGRVTDRVAQQKKSQGWVEGWFSAARPKIFGAAHDYALVFGNQPSLGIRVAVNDARYPVTALCTRGQPITQRSPLWDGWLRVEGHLLSSSLLA